jgi:hypothetical protein
VLTLRGGSQCAIDTIELGVVLPHPVENMPKLASSQRCHFDGITVLH